MKRPTVGMGAPEMLPNDTEASGPGQPRPHPGWGERLLSGQNGLTGVGEGHKRGKPMDPRAVDAFRSILGEGGLITRPEELRTYECDGLTNFRVVPGAVLLPSSLEQVQGVVRICHRERIPFVARGAGTGLSGGALPVANGIVISLA